MSVLTKVVEAVCVLGLCLLSRMDIVVRMTQDTSTSEDTAAVNNEYESGQTDECHDAAQSDTWTRLVLKVITDHSSLVQRTEDRGRRTF